tara:strand:- start:558 stop:869 length:312 start_codon:yes stop_codon:yes gene_type:complete
MLTPEQVAEIRQDNERIWSEEADTRRLGNVRLLLSDRADALLELAQVKRDFRDCVKSHQKANAELEMLWAAVADAPHDIWCAVTFPAAPADLMSCNCWKSETK